MRQQAIGKLFLVGLMLTAVSTTVLAGPPADEDNDEPGTAAVQGQTEPPPAPAPIHRAKPARTSRPASAARPTGFAGFLFFNPRNPRNVPKSPSEAPSGYISRQQEDEATGEKIAWQTNFKAAHRKAVAAQKPLLLVFGATWCPACRKMNREVLSRPEIVEQIQRGFIPVHLDADENQSLTELLEVETIPAVVVLNADLEVVKRADGYQSVRNLATLLKNAKSAQEQKVLPASLEAPEE